MSGSAGKFGYSRATLLGLVLILEIGAVQAQIGGKTAADGPFLLEDMEDMDLIADGVMRNWVLDRGVELTTLTLTTAGLTLASGQSPIGAFHASVPSKFNFVSGGFGVPVPSVVGASTLDSPGNITSFDKLTFLACFEPTLPGQKFQVVLETYPGPDYPHIYWNYTPALGSTFQRVEINLRQPSTIQSTSTLTLENLLSQTRYLYFFTYAGPLTSNARVHLYLDDIRLEAGSSTGGLAVRRWTLFY